MSEPGLPEFGLKDDRLWHYRARVLRVIDGDTAVLFIDRGMNEFSVEKVRLAGIDAPELRPRVGTSEQRAAEKVLAEETTQRLRDLIDGKEVVVRTGKTGKFGRYLADIYLPGSTSDTVNRLLLDEGLAVVYGEPRPWRDE